MTYDWTKYKLGYADGTSDHLDGLEDQLWNKIGTFGWDHDEYWDGYGDGWFGSKDKTTIKPKTWRDGYLLNLRSSLSKIPLLVVDRQVKFGLVYQFKHPFGLYIRLPFVWARWGAA